MSSLYAQDAEDEWETFLSDFTMEEEREDDEDMMLLLEELKHLHENPTNINTATVEDLRRLPFLDDNQIEQIHAYIYLHGEMQTLGELQLVPLLDSETIRRLRLFLYAEGTTVERKDGIFDHLRHELSTRVDIPLYYRKGFMTSKGGYAGDPLYNRIKYEVGNTRHFRAGVHMEKDAGERFYDSYGAFAMLQDVGILHKAVVGDYRIGFGEGLVVGGSSWMSKSTPSMKTQSGIRPMTGTDESSFLRGAAATLKAGHHVGVSLFASFRQIDATLSKDGNLQTIVSGGYHRTTAEREKKNNVSTTLFGGNVSWNNHGFHLGITGYMQHFSRQLVPGDEAYRAFYPRGSNFGVAGVDYGYSRYRLSLAGETAYSIERGGIATLNRASWTISKRYTLSAIQRHYAKEYRSLQSGAFAEGSTAQNETGVMLHLKAEPWDGWSITSYMDFFYNQWPRYRIPHSSSGQDFMLQLSHIINKVHSLTARYQLKRKETATAMELHNRAKLQWTVSPSKQWKLQTTALFHEVLGDKGWALQESASHTFQKPSIRLSATLGYFRTDNYNSRIYLYEPSLYSSISSGQYYGRGIHSVLTARWTSPHGRWMAEARYSLTRYTDRNEQGSAMQTIFSPWKNDLSLQLRMRL